MSTKALGERVAALARTLQGVVEQLDEVLFDELRAEAETLRADGSVDEAALALHRANERRLQRARRALERAVRELEGGA